MESGFDGSNPPKSASLNLPTIDKTGKERNNRQTVDKYTTQSTIHDDASMNYPVVAKFPGNPEIIWE